MAPEPSSEQLSNIGTTPTPHAPRPPSTYDHVQVSTKYPQIFFPISSSSSPSLFFETKVLLCRTGYPGTHSDLTCFCLPSTVIEVVCPHGQHPPLVAQLRSMSLNRLYFVCLVIASETSLGSREEVDQMNIHLRRKQRLWEVV